MLSPIERTELCVLTMLCHALASRPALQEGLWSWISGVTDNSLYPVMLAANLQLWIPALASGWPRTWVATPGGGGLACLHPAADAGTLWSGCACIGRLLGALHH